MKYPSNIREEELKNKIANDYFWRFDCTKIIGNVDFCVALFQSQQELFEQTSLLWAEAKRGSSNIYASITQLILTVGKARTFDKYLPPAFVGALDSEKIAFVPYSEVQEIFYQNDFNWNVTPSNHETREFKQVLEKVTHIIETNALLFHYEKDAKELKKFIKENFVAGKFGITKIQIDKNNFISVYNKWLSAVKPTIAVDWQIAKKNGIIDGDFYLADLLSYENDTLRDKLFVLLRKDHYELDRKFNEMGMFSSLRTEFNDEQVAHKQFWNRYQRPPKEEYWDYIVERRDLLVPQDIRERRGSFFTPQVWVELSQKYLADVLGINWQDDYIIWDCAAGTGNLLNGLTNKYNIYASTLDKQDVDVMHDRIENGANLLHEHVFQFDFLNDDFIPKSKGGKIPDSLFDIISNPYKLKKLVVYINPPYAEATTARTVTGTGENKPLTATNNKTYLKYREKLSKASNELFAQFLIRIYDELNGCWIANFSTLKNLQSANFKKFREIFLAKLERLFIVPADTFDNVNGQFPIGFYIWNTYKKEKFIQIQAEVYNHKANLSGTKAIYGDLNKSINKWIKEFDDKKIRNPLGYLENPTPDFQNNKFLNISSTKGSRHNNYLFITKENLFVSSVYFSVRLCIPSTWLNDRDQFLYPNDGWKEDKEFQNDCLMFTLFHSQNRISSKYGTNHWIPFVEDEINARERFESHFMSDFIRGKLKKKDEPGTHFPMVLFEPTAEYGFGKKGLRFSKEANDVYHAGKELWRYYHSKPHINVNASLYDIREYFQGRSANGRMNNSSADTTYNQLIENLRDALKNLAEKIEPKVYEYGFLRL